MTGVNPDQLRQASAHWLRHTAATGQSLAGVSLRYIREFLGHASYDTTLIYDHGEDEEWLAQLSRFGLVTSAEKTGERPE